ncbi:hypothetical protein CKM354_000489300 [Cercospora kikuchii]|uniref:C2H2 type master regulator of conidiophore development brlA n=1 Tax=Cercospora kikuchii TaxID=84275 RepID=A0A9P3FG81_9PEZI|nr:uncharacterized protein CKM354_000489300 [Cercospora kikuchii]GIZ41594.1 hypothetical protein CKM354_000489300 [Cercospora kikuchii]
MSFYPADHYNNDDDSMGDWKHYTYEQMRQPGTTLHDSDEKFNVTDPNSMYTSIGTSSQDPYPSSQPMTLPAETCSLGLDSLQTPTQAMFNNSSSALSTPHIPSSWALQQTHPTYTFPEVTRSDLQFDQYYPTSSALTDHAQWRPLHQVPEFATPAYESVTGRTSPAHSEHSESSYSSLIASSPYAQSDGYFQAPSPPDIKSEESLDQGRGNLYSVPGVTADEISTHVDPSDIFATHTQDVSGPGTTSNTPVKHDKADLQYLHNSWPLSTRSVPHSGHDSNTVGSSYASDADARLKRAFTTAENSTCQCRECGKMFQRVYNLRAHMLTHDPQREHPYACEYRGCARRFVRRTDLVRHEQSVHLKARNFACPMCQNAFARKDTLRRHVDEGCPNRPEVKKRIGRRRSSGGSAALVRPASNIPHVSSFAVVKTERE